MREGAIFACREEYRDLAFAGLYYLNTSRALPSRFWAFSADSYHSLDTGVLVSFSEKFETAVVNSDRNYEEQSAAAGRLLRLSWPADPASPPTVTEEAPLQGESPAYSSISVHSKLLDPRGRYAVISRFVNPYSTSKTSSSTYLGSTLVELWMTGDLEPQGPLPLRVGAIAIGMVTNRDGDKLLIQDDDHNVHFIKLDRLFSSDPSRFEPRTWSTGPYGRYTFADYGGGDIHIFDKEVGAGETIVPPEFRADLIGWYHDADAELSIIVTHDSIVRLEGGVVTKKINAPAHLTGFLYSRDVFTIFAEESMYVFDRELNVRGPAVSDNAEFASFVRSIVSGDAVQGSGFRRSEGQPDELVSCFVSSVGKEPDESFWIWDRLQCWSLKYFGAEGVEAHLTLNQALTHGRTYTLSPLPQADLAALFVYGDYREGTTPALTIYDALSGSAVDTFKPPAGGWPSDFRGIEAFRRVMDGFALFINYADSGASLDFATAYCLYKSDGGECSPLRKISREDYAEVSFVETDSAGIGYAMVTEGGDASIIKLDDGKIVWHMDNVDPMLPYVVLDSPVGWVLKNPDQQSRLRQLIALGGEDAFESVSTVPLPKEERESLNEIVSRLTQ